MIHQFASNFQATGRTRSFESEVTYERGEETNAAGEKGGSEDEIDEPPPNVPKIASYIWLARPFAFSNDKVHYENRK